MRTGAKPKARPYRWEVGRGCRAEARDAEGNPKTVAKWCGQELRRCPTVLIPDWALPLLRSWEAYSQHGTLPGPGGLYDQPALWIDAMNTISQTVAECERENVKDTERFADLPRLNR